MRSHDPSLDDWLALIGEPALVVRASGEIVAANRRFTEIVGDFAPWSRLEELLSTSSADLHEQLKTWARNKQALMGSLRLRTPDGEFAAGVRGGRLSGVHQNEQSPLLLLVMTPRRKAVEAFRTLTEQVDALTREISRRKRTEQELLRLKESLEKRVAERTEQLRRLAGRLIAAEEAERRRLAHTLHDNLQQLLVSGIMQAEKLKSVSDEPEVREISDRLHHLLKESVGVSRTLTLELSPPVLRDAGLCAGLAWLGRRYQTQNGLNVEVETDERAEPDDEALGIALFSAAGELLLNIVKHAGVDTAAVTLHLDERGNAALRVQDDGRGFDLASATSHDREGGFGLFSLRERAELLGGELRIDTAPGEGTTVEMVVPQRATQRTQVDRR